MAAKNFRKLFEPYTVKSMTLRNRIVMTPIGTNFAEHTGEVIVDTTCKDGTKGDPQEDHRAPQSALQGTEDRAQASDVQQLDEEQLPLRHHDVVNAIVDADSRSFTVVRSERVVNDLAINKIANDQDRQTE